jgi:hypothetical protein
MVVSLVQIPWAQALRPYAAHIIDPEKCSFVTPAQAGGPVLLWWQNIPLWIPACAGMTSTLARGELSCWSR